MNIIFIFFSTTEYKNKKFLLCLTILTFSQNSMIQTHNSFFLRLVRYKLANVNHKVWIATYKLAILRNCRNSEKWKFFSLQLWLYFLQFSLCHAILKKISELRVYISQFWLYKSQLWVYISHNSEKKVRTVSFFHENEILVLKKIKVFF